MTTMLSAVAAAAAAEHNGDGLALMSNRWVYLRVFLCAILTGISD